MVRCRTPAPAQYSAGLALNPNAVVIQLGTNDSATANFNLGTNDFVDSLTSIITAYQGTANHPAIWLVLPPTIYTAAPSDNEANLDLLMPYIRQVAAATGATLIDNHTMTQSESNSVRRRPAPRHPGFGHARPEYLCVAD